MGGWRADRQTDRETLQSPQGCPPVLSGPTRGEDVRFPSGGSAEVWWVRRCLLLSSSLKASDPRLARACPPHRQRVPGACPAPDACPQEELHLARVPRTSRDTSAGPPVPQALNRVSRRRRAHCSLQERRGARGAGDRGAAAGSARPPAPPGLGGRLQRGCVPASFTRAESTSGGTDEQDQVRTGAWAGVSRGMGALQCARDLIRGRLRCSPLGREDTRARSWWPWRGGQASGG